MTKYLLLRDNKQSGPFTVDDLRVKGLKPYDLVWLEGKSAAWRYPSEIEELMPFAPVVEEQPFDRFYKKPSQANSGNNNNVTAQPGNANVVSSQSGKKIIYVTLPAGAGKAAPVLRDPGPREQPAVSPQSREQPAAPPQAREQPAAAAQDSPAPSYSEYAVPDKGSAGSVKEDAMARPRTDQGQALRSIPAAVENFSRASQDSKESVEIAPRVKKRGWSRPLQLMVLGAGIVALLAAGVFIGLSINKDNSGIKQKLAGVSALPAATPLVTKDVAPPIAQPVTSVTPVTTTTTTASLAAASPKSPETTVNKPRKQLIPNVASDGKGSSGIGQQKALLASTPVKDSGTAMTSLPVVQREASHRTDASGAADKDALKPNIANLVSVSANGYIVGTFGGISDLQVTVSNHSNFPLDLVVVEVQYIQANKRVFKTENLNFHNIGAGSALMLEAPKTSRGIKVQYRVTLINSKESGLSYSAI
jgi:hypothetical protein